MNSPDGLLKLVGDEPEHIFSELNEIKSGINKVKCYTCTPNRNFENLPMPIQLLKCGGAGTSELESINSAVGEGLERYAALCYSLSDPFCRSSYNDLMASNRKPTQVLDPDLWIKYSPHQYEQLGFGLSPLTHDSVIKWYQASSYRTKESYLAPGPLCIFAYRRGKTEQRHSPTTSTGLALGTSFEKTHLSGLLEVIERDSVVLAWTYRRPVLRINPSDAHLQDILTELGITNEYNVTLYNLVQDAGIPTYFATLEHSYQDQVLLCAGSASRLDDRSAARKAILEAAQGVPYTKWLYSKFNTDSDVPFDWVDSFEKSAIYYSLERDKLEEIRSQWGDLFRVEREVDLPHAVNEHLSSDKQQLEGVLARLLASGHEAYFIDCTQADLLRENLSVVKSLVPSMYSLEGNYAHRVVNPSRARSLAKRDDVVKQILPTQLSYFL